MLKILTHGSLKLNPNSPICAERYPTSDTESCGMFVTQQRLIVKKTKLNR